MPDRIVGPCDSCRFWERYTLKSERGRCNRYPPLPLYTTPDRDVPIVSVWPTTHENDSCGEWRQA